MFAFTRLFIEYKKQDYTNDQMGLQISELKKRLVEEIEQIDSKKLNDNAIIFTREYTIIPSIKEDQTTIAKFILKYGL